MIKTILLILISILFFKKTEIPKNDLKQEIIALEKNRVLQTAQKYLNEEIQTITGVSCERSAGGIHDFYSEGDYWWPDPENTKGPYIRKDGLTNPENFIEHRIRMRRLSMIVPNLVAAYIITNKKKYANKALEHVNAWFVNEATKMNPNMLYSQAIYGRVTGRGIGIIDAIHLVEVVKAMMLLEAKGIFDGDQLTITKKWFSDFNSWITTHPYGIDEKNNGNNHSTCWAMQVAMFAQFTQNKTLLKECKVFYQQVLLPEQLAPNGSFPKEIDRTKPYGYSLFNLDAMYTLVHILSKEYPDIWEYQANNQLNILNAIEFMFPYIKDKDSWPYPEDVMYFEDWPMRHTSLLFAYQAFGDTKYLELWKTLPANSEKNEVLRNFFIRQPILWVN